MNRRIARIVTLALALAVGAAANGTPVAAAEPARAIFAGGCFWCVEAAFDAVPGVIATNPGYIGGTVPDPTYDQVSAGGTGHAEAVEVRYDPERTSYPQLLAVFWRNIDPHDAGGQFCDHGNPYRSAIFAVDAEQRRLAEESRHALANSGLLSAPIATEITDAGAFYPAEEYHRDYYLKNPARYKFYRWNCGRDQRLDVVWGKIGKLPFEVN
ncbi:MAG: peptide-methionine (S)-S-oxide reductase MsrA [Gammaproteobacteria bacterium]|nr:peptide-methionine (S)-S-oxide reductase MsrA [Gammaproteobacteria bacterium]